MMPACLPVRIKSICELPIKRKFVFCTTTIPARWPTRSFRFRPTRYFHFTRNKTPLDISSTRPGTFNFLLEEMWLHIISPAVSFLLFIIEIKILIHQAPAVQYCRRLVSCNKMDKNNTSWTCRWLNSFIPVEVINSPSNNNPPPVLMKLKALQ